MIGRYDSLKGNEVDEKKIRRQVILSRIAFDWLFSFIVGGIIFFLLNKVFPEYVSFEKEMFKNFLWLLVIFMMYKSIRKYQRDFKTLEDSDYLFKVKNEKDGLEKLKGILLTVNYRFEINKERLNILKTFSPIPIIIVVAEYFLSFIQSNLTNILSFHLDFSVNEWFTIAFVIGFLYYIYQFKKTWELHISLSKEIYDIKRHIHEVESNH